MKLQYFADTDSLYIHLSSKTSVQSDEVAEGVVVDTHVRRLSRRMRLTRHTDPAKIERDLMALLPRSQWIEFSHRMIWHGRAICPARRPRCGECPLVPDCPTSRDYLPTRPGSK